MANSLTKEEKEILDSVELGEWKSTPNFQKRKVELQKIASATLTKNKNVNIRISERDLQELQKQAIKEGLSYQNFISSILHKFAGENI